LAVSRRNVCSPGESAPRVDVGGLRDQRRAARQAAAGQRRGQLTQPVLGGAARTQRLIDRQHFLVRQGGELGGPAQVLRQLRVAVPFRHDRLQFQRVRVNAQIGDANLTGPHGVHGQLGHRFAGQGTDPCP